MLSSIGTSVAHANQGPLKVKVTGIARAIFVRAVTFILVMVSTLYFTKIINTVRRHVKYTI